LNALKNAALITLVDIWNSKIAQENEDADELEEEKKKINEFCKAGLEENSKSFEEFLEAYEFAPELRDKLYAELETLFPKMIGSIYRKVINILEDPRDHGVEEPESPGRKSNASIKKIKIPSIENYLEGRHAEEYTFNALSLIYELKNGYLNIHDFNDLEEEHYKLFTYKLDVLLTMVERYCFHKNFMEHFSKYRVMQVVGLAAGFAIKGEDLIRANCTVQLNNYGINFYFTLLIH
jgi:hypothetical protein